jgi:hypothetical protein
LAKGQGCGCRGPSCRLGSGLRRPEGRCHGAIPSFTVG